MPLFLQPVIFAGETIHQLLVSRHKVNLFFTLLLMVGNNFRMNEKTLAFYGEGQRHEGVRFDMSCVRSVRQILPKPTHHFGMCIGMAGASIFQAVVKPGVFVSAKTNRCRRQARRFLVHLKSFNDLIFSIIHESIIVEYIRQVK